MEFSKLYSLLVEKDKEKFVPGEKSDSSDDKAKDDFDKEADKIAKDQSAADVKSDNDDPFKKLGAGAGNKLANKLFGAKHTPAAAKRALAIGAERKIAADNIPSWVWTQMIPADAHGQDRVIARDEAKGDYKKLLDYEPDDEDEPKKPEDKPHADDEDDADEPVDKPEPSSEEKAKAEKEKKEAEKAERESEKAEKAAAKEEEADTEKKDKAKDVKLKA